MSLKRLLKRKKKQLNRKYFQKTIDKDELLKDLHELGIGSGMSIYVHSALSKIGNVLGGPDTVIKALIESVTLEGTVIMPGFTIENSMRETLKNYQDTGRIFNYKKDIPNVGAIPATFFQKQGVIRSIHPTHSVLAWGRLSKSIISGHKDSSTTFGIGTPLHKLLETNSYLVGLGSNLAHVTFYHVIEDILNNYPIQIYEQDTYNVRVRLDDDTIKMKRYFAHRSQEYRIEHKDSRWLMDHYEDYFTQYGGMVKGKVGLASCWMISANNMYECVDKLLQEGYSIYTNPSRKMEK
jgi:aminoglycoside 3-N-acetyltransferase